MIVSNVCRYDCVIMMAVMVVVITEALKIVALIFSQNIFAIFLSGRTCRSVVVIAVVVVVAVVVVAVVAVVAVVVVVVVAALVVVVVGDYACACVCAFLSLCL